MSRPTMRLTYDPAPRSPYVTNQGMANHHALRPARFFVGVIVLAFVFPYSSVVTFRWLDKLPIWDQRIRE